MFERGVGEVTDVVEKELFRLAPRSEDGETWSLRPEPTAGIVRAYIQHGMQTWPQPVKLMLTGRMFRYDRPQAGRYREFWQCDFDTIGTSSNAADIETALVIHDLMMALGVNDFEVRINNSVVNPRPFLERGPDVLEEARGTTDNSRSAAAHG